MAHPILLRMPVPKIEALSLYGVRNTIKANPDLALSEGWRPGEPLGADFQAIADDLKTWLKSEHGWSLNHVGLMITRDQEVPKRGYGEIVPVPTEELTMMFGFTAEDPPFDSRLFELWRKPQTKLDLDAAFCYEWPTRERYVHMQNSTPKIAILGANNYGPLLFKEAALKDPSMPYYLTDMAVARRTTSPELIRESFDRGVKLPKDVPELDLSIVIQTKDLVDLAHEESNQRRRVMYKLKKDLAKSETINQSDRTNNVEKWYPSL